MPFFSISGSDFVEMFVGVGASRVRDLFEQGKKNAPCIIFIDEIDAVGRHRGAGLGGGHDEREQTLNQLLVEMDGFETNEGVILIAATNRPDVLDPALLRPGRFDRRVVVDRPDVLGRLGILQVHSKSIPLSDDVDLEVLARGTPGFAGADLANLVNEAALIAARRGKKSVEMEDFEYAKDKVLMGVERKTMVLSDEEKEITAYHEAGHALVAAFTPEADPLHKVTIIPRGRALGLTMQLPTEDQHTYKKKYVEAQISILMGGRVAEELTQDDITTGAGNDIERATDLARQMVCEWGMSSLGPLSLGGNDEPVFLGRDFQNRAEYSEETAKRIDAEVERIVQGGYLRATDDPHPVPRGARPRRERAARARGARRRRGLRHHPRDDRPRAQADARAPARSQGSRDARQEPGGRGAHEEKRQDRGRRSERRARRRSRDRGLPGLPRAGAGIALGVPAAPASHHRRGLNRAGAMTAALRSPIRAVGACRIPPPGLARRDARRLDAAAEPVALTTPVATLATARPASGACVFPARAHWCWAAPFA